MVFRIPFAFTVHGEYEGKPYVSRRALVLRYDENRTLVGGFLCKCSHDFDPPDPDLYLDQVYYDRFNRLNGYIYFGGDN